MAATTRLAKTLARGAAALTFVVLALQAGPASAQTLAIGDASSPSSVTLCPGGAATNLDAFTMQATVTNDVVTRLTVQLVPAGSWVNVRLIEITNSAGTTVYGSAIPGGDQTNVYVGTLAVSTGPATTYNVRITPQTPAGMPAPNLGQQYAITGTVVSVASNNPRTYSDTGSATITIDNLAPAEIQWTTVSNTANSITLNWAAATNVVVLQVQGVPVTSSPAEGTSYVTGNVIGAALVTFAGSNSTATATPLITGFPYYFKVFTRDPCFNYSLGAPIGPLFVNGTNEGSLVPNATVPVVGIINPISPTTVTSIPAGPGFRVQVRAFSRPNVANAAQPLTAVRLKAATPGQPFTSACTNAVADYPINLAVNANYPSSNSGVAGTNNYGVYEANVMLARGPYTLRACATNTSGTVFSGPVDVTVNDGTAGSPKGDGHLLVRDNGGQLCSDCHTLPTHSSEAVGSKYGSWYADCRDCHTPHSTTNVELIRRVITPPGVNGQQPPKTVIFSNRTGVGFNPAGGVNSVVNGTFANGDYTGVCQVCHTRTAHFLNSATGDDETHNPSQPCTACHAHDKGLKASCTTCHGAKGAYTPIPGADSNAASAPPTAADKVTITGVKVGAHQAHVNQATYRTNPLACADCHPIPNTHNGTADAAWSVLATNTIINGVSLAVSPTPAAVNGYTTTWEGTPTCTNACHGANIPSNAPKPAPSWTGGALTCTSCHGAPPPLSATGNQTHPRNTSCNLCHGAGYALAAVNKPTHIDGTLNRTTSGCTACHGDIGVAGVTLSVNMAASAPGQTGGANSIDTTGSTNTLSPGVGAHIHHLTTTIYRGPVLCTECHALPPSDTDTAHATGASTSGSRATLTFGNLAKGVGAAFNNELVSPVYSGSTSAAYGATAGTCGSTYCHGQFRNGSKATISWTATSITCNSCHGRAAGATATEPTGNHPYPAATCGNCHSGYTGTTVNLASHVNGALEVTLNCTSCHGDTSRAPVVSATLLDVFSANLVKAAPPTDATTGALSGNLVGAHLAHVNQWDTLAPGVLSSALICANCHAGQVWTTAPHATPANPVLWGNIATDNGVVTPTVYNPATKTCSNTYCHGNWKYGNGSANISWGNGSVAKQACNTCHGQGAGIAQPTYPHPQNTTCVSCHPGYTSTTVAATTHVDAITTKSTSGCTACHGELGAPGVTRAVNLVKAAPGASLSANSYDTTGLATGNSIGAHEAHLVGAGGTLRWRSTPIACTDCHALPISDTDTTHATGAGTSGARATLTFSPFANGNAFETKTAAYSPRYTCANTYCHDPKSADTQTLPVVQVNAPAWNGPTTAAQCGSCHGLPPATPSHPANTACGNCHPGYANAPGSGSTITSVDPALHMNGALDGGGESSGGVACSGCHSAIYVAMNTTSTTLHHHYMANATAPALGSYTTSTSAKTCTQCHVDHSIFRPDLNPGNGARAKNLRTGIAAQPSATANFTDTDHVAAGSTGICVSCHGTRLAKANGDTGFTPVVSGTDFQAGAHNYVPTPNSQFADASTFKPNCSKCHDGNTALTVPAYQGGTGNRYALHDSNVISTLDPLGYPGSPQPYEEDFCYRCHSQTTDAGLTGTRKPTAQRDWYGTQVMTTASEKLYAVFQYAFKHVIAGTRGRHTPDSDNVALANRHVQCSDCHDPHGARSRASGTQTGTVTAYTPGTGDTLTDSTKAAWTANLWKGYTVRILTGTQAGQSSAIYGSASTTLTVEFATAIPTGSAYIIEDFGTRLAAGTMPAGSPTLGSAEGVIPTFNTPPAPANWNDSGGCGAAGTANSCETITASYATAPTFTAAGTLPSEAYICLKCHSSYAFGSTPPNSPSGQPNSTTSTWSNTVGVAMKESDLAGDMNPGNAGHHAVFARGKNQPMVSSATVKSFLNPNWPRFTTGTVAVTSGGTTVTLTGGTWPVGLLPGWFIYVGSAAPMDGKNGGSTGWYEVTGVTSTTVLSVDRAFASALTAQAYTLTPGLGAAFVPPWGPWSQLHCSDCHRSAAITDPLGPHGSTTKWLLRSAQAQTFLTYPSGANPAAAVVTNTPTDPNNFCLNCHRRDVYGDYTFLATPKSPVAGAVYYFSRQLHPPDKDNGSSADYRTNWGIMCFNCHGGARQGGMHGLNIGKGNGGVNAASYSGKRLLAGSSWYAVTRGSSTTAGTCWTKGSTDAVDNCGHSHGGVAFQSGAANYDYEPSVTGFAGVPVVP